MANSGPKGIVRYEETLVANAVAVAVTGVAGNSGAATGIGWLTSIDTGDTAFTRAMSATKGLHLAGSMAATNNNLIELCGDQLMFYGQTGFNAVDVLLQLDTVATVAFNFGFNDDVIEAANTLPIEGTATTMSTNSSAFCGIIYDPNMDNDELHAYWCDDGVASTETLANMRMQGFSIVADHWLWMRVEMQDRGSGNGVRATFHAAQNGKTMTKEFNTSVDRDVGLCWYLGIENRAGLARGAYVKLPSWEQSIAD